VELLKKDFFVFNARFVEPAERIAQQVLAIAFASGLLYGAITYGPKALKIYEIFQDDANQLASVVTLLQL